MFDLWSERPIMPRRLTVAVLATFACVAACKARAEAPDPVAARGPSYAAAFASSAWFPAGRAVVGVTIEL